MSFLERQMPLFANPIAAIKNLRVRFFAENSFYAKLLGAGLVGVLAIAVLAVYFIFLAFHERDDDLLRARSFATLRAAGKIGNALANLGTNQRNYLLTGDKTFLETYKRGLKDFYTFHGDLSGLEAGNPPQLVMLAKIRDGLERWKTQAAQPEIAAKQDGSDVMALVMRDHGKEMMDALHLSIAEFEQNETGLYEKINSQAMMQRILKTGGLAVLCVFAMGFLIASNWHSFKIYSRHLNKIELAGEQTRLIIRTAVDGIVTWNDQGVILSVNPAAEKMFGHEAAELVGKTVTKIMPHRLFLHDIKNLGHGTMMATAQRSNFFPFPIEVSFSEMNADGRRNFVALIRDVTNRNRMEETLRHIGSVVLATIGKEFIHSLVKQLSKALQSDFAFVIERIKNEEESTCSLVLAEQGNIRSKTNYKLANTPFEEVLNKGFRAYSGDARARFPNDGILQELSVHSFVAMPLVDHNGRPVGVIGVLDREPMENIEIVKSALQIFALRAGAEIERQRYEADLAGETERLAVTLRSIGDGFITTDVEGRILLLNNVAKKLTGWERDTAVGHPLAEVFNIQNESTRKPILNAILNAVERIIETGSAVGRTNHSLLVARDGTERLIETNASPIHDKKSNIIGIVLIFRDVTEKRRVEEERHKAEKLESLGVAAGGIAHDFNNLLTGIIGNLSLAMLSVDPNDDVAGHLNTAKKASLRAQDLAQQLLTFAKGGAPVKKTKFIGQLIRDTVSFALSGSNAQTDISVPENLWPVEIDAGQIDQVLANLVTNAAQAMPAGGTVEVRCENFPLDQEDSTLSDLRPGRYVKIVVQDEGVGIPSEHLKKIFDPYFTTKPKGSGLGLATTYSIIKNHDGMITVESRVGAGSTFCVYLPASDKEVPLEKVASQMPMPVGSGKILVMDDEEVICEIIRCVLTSLGYSVTESHDGDACIRIYEEALRAGKPFDAVIMDLTIPGGMGGKDAVQKLIELNPSVKAIATSGYSKDPVMSRPREYGFCATLAKPYEISELAQIVHEVIGAKNENLI